MSTFTLDHFQFALIHGPDIPGSYVILFFIALDFAFTTRHIHNWASFLPWPNCFTVSGAISDCLLLLPSSILDTFQPGGLFFQCHIFLPFHTVHSMNSGLVCHPLLQWTMFCENSPLWLVHLGWLCTAWLIASLGSISPFATKKPWSMKGKSRKPHRIPSLQNWVWGLSFTGYVFRSTASTNDWSPSFHVLVGCFVFPKFLLRK